MIEIRNNRKSESYRFSFSAGSMTGWSSVKNLRNNVSMQNKGKRVVVRWREPIGDGYYDQYGNLIGGERYAMRGDVYVYNR